MENQNQKNSENSPKENLPDKIKMAIVDHPTNQLVVKAYSDSSWDEPDYALVSIYPELMDQLQRALLALQELTKEIPAGELILLMGNFSFHKFQNDTIGIEEALQDFTDEKKPFLYVQDADPEELSTVQTCIWPKIGIDLDGNIVFRAEGMFTSEQYWTEPIHYQQLTYVFIKK